MIDASVLTRLHAAQSREAHATIEERVTDTGRRGIPALYRRACATGDLRNEPLQFRSGSVSRASDQREGGLTAEVAILSRAGVAVAADSAVTVGKNKVHVAGNKIFQVCDRTPMGVMVYGFSEYCGVPWEIIVKLFRAEKARDGFATVKECYTEIRKFLSDDRFLRNRDTDVSLALFSISVIEQLRSRITKLPSKSRAAGIKSLVSTAIEEYRNRFVEGEALNYAPPTLREFRATCTAAMNTIMDDIFSDIGYEPPNTIRRSVVELVHAALCSTHVSEYVSGFVVFGFGADQIMPQLTLSEIDGAPLYRVRSIEYEGADYGSGGACIYPFADREIMDMFIDGISRQMKDWVSEAIRSSGLEIARRVIRDNLNLSAAETRVAHRLAGNFVSEVSKKLDEELEHFIHIENTGEVISIVDQMPKEELATLAEALVELEAIRKKVSPEIESVGGPIDVCVVTKSDGFIWIKRKHYFDLAKNIQYLARRFDRLPIVPVGVPDASKP